MASVRDTQSDFNIFYTVFDCKPVRSSNRLVQVDWLLAHVLWPPGLGVALVNEHPEDGSHFRLPRSRLE